VRLLCASNLHLGRSTYGVPGRLGIDHARLSMTATWDALGDLARAESVDAVVIAGDLIDRENRRFEPIGPIERGLTTLARHDIPLIIVAGDEDVDAVRALADSDATGALRLLGRDGTWETMTVSGRDGETRTIAGWSAPGRTVTSSPAAELQGGADIVVLHGTPGDAGFAPFSVGHLDRLGGQLWIAGAPMVPERQAVGDTALLAPGAPAALSPTDTGARGAWIVDLAGDRVDARQVPLAAIRFDRVEVDLSGCDGPDAAESRIIGALQEMLDAAVEADVGSHLVAVCTHLSLSGRTPIYGDLPARLDELQRTTDLQREGVVLAIVNVVDGTVPDIAVGQLLERADPVGESARVVQVLDTGTVDEMPLPYQDLLRRTANRLSEAHRSRVFAAVSHDPEPGVEEARALLLREAWATLHALVRQRGIDQERGQA
jgi:DNA repair protein SbcD/Mre11